MTTDTRSWYLTVMFGAALLVASVSGPSTGWAGRVVCGVVGALLLTSTALYRVRCAGRWSDPGATVKTVSRPMWVLLNVWRAWVPMLVTATAVVAGIDHWS